MSPAAGNPQLLQIGLCIILTFPSAGAWIVPQPNQNIWVTLATTLQQDNLCLSMHSVDYLLLAHGHGCQDFDGMCCFNLFTHSESIHVHIQKLREQVKELKTENSDWISELFRHWGLTGWVSSFVKGIILIVTIVFIILLVFPCLAECLQKPIGEAFLVSKNGGIVESLVPLKEFPSALPWKSED